MQILYLCVNMSVGKPFLLQKIDHDQLLTKHMCFAYEFTNKLINANTNDDLTELQNKVSQLYYDYMQDMYGRMELDCGVFSWSRFHTTPYTKLFSQISKKILKLNPNFELDVNMTENEIINNYLLYDCQKNLFNFSDFQKFKKIYEENTPITFEEFTNIYEETACSEWSRQDENGESFVGFWNAPEGSYERKNAWKLTRDKNCKSLYDLPYPKLLIIESIKFGCNERLECVRYSNFFCEFVKRKVEIMRQPSKTTETETQSDLDECED